MTASLLLLSSLTLVGLVLLCLVVHALYRKWRPSGGRLQLPEDRSAGAGPPELTVSVERIEPGAEPPPPAVPSEAPEGPPGERPHQPCRHPVIFAHGLLGFDTIGFGGVAQHYFKGVPRLLEERGTQVYVLRVSPMAGIRVRAEQLARQIQALPAGRVNIIAHSMGGLDARYAITHLGLAERTASLTTIGTPHQGTPLADSASLVDFRPVRRMLASLGADVDGLYELTRPSLTDFNRLVPDVPSVEYASCIGAVRSGLRCVHPLLAPGFAYLSRTAGINDGLVPAESQRWGSVVDEVDADHWAQIGWSGTFDVQAFYLNLVDYLGRRGL